MDQNGWVALLIQVPLVGVFIWYSLQMNRRQDDLQQQFMNALDKRDEAFERRNAAIVAAVTRTAVAIEAHSARSDMAFLAIFEKLGEDPPPELDYPTNPRRNK